MRLIIKGLVPGFLENDPSKTIAPRNAMAVIDVPDWQFIWLPVDDGVRLVWGKGIPGEILGVEATESYIES